MTIQTTAELLSAGDLVDRLTAASLDDLRALHGRLEDSQRVIRAIIREKQFARRRDAALAVRQTADASS